MLGEQHVAGDDRLLGDRGPAGAARARPDTLALVHLGALGEPRLLRVLGDDAVERLDVLQRAAHEHGVVDALAVVGEDPDPRRRSRPSRRARRAARPRRPTVTAPTGLHVAVAGLAAEPPDLLDDAGGVGDRVGVGHRVHGGEAAERGGPGAGHDGLGVLAAGLAQVGVQVDQAGQRDQPVGVDDLGAVGGQRRRRSSAITPSSSSRSVGSPPSDPGARDQVRRSSGVSSSGRSAVGRDRPARSRRAAGTARPSGRRRRW